MNYMKVLKGSHAIKLFIKSSVIAIALLLSVVFSSKAQERLNFPFQGGVQIMNRFFTDSLTISPDLIQKRATGTAIFKFTADLNGVVTKIIIYYADDYVLTTPLIEALKRSSKQWVIPDNEKQHDFIIPFSINFNPPTTGGAEAAQSAYKFYKQRHPIVSTNQIPISTATLLPTVVINYNLK
jgi:hypothetical protein